MKYYTVKEFAKKFRVSENAIYNLVKKGEIKKVEGLGKSIRIPSSELKILEKINYDLNCNKEKIEAVETHLGKVRKLKGKDEYITSDLYKALGLHNSYSILKRVDESTYRRVYAKEACELGIFNNNGITLINYKGIVEYSKRSRSRNIIDFNRLLKELKVNDYEQVKFKEVEDKSIELTNMFEGRDVEIITINGQVLFELYSTGMALGYENKRRNSTGKVYIGPYKSKIDKVVESADITCVCRGVTQYLTEEMLYDFMLEAKTEKCKSFRKWVTNEVLPTIRKTGGYVDNTNKFTDFYFSNLSLEVRQAIKKELVNRNNEILIRTKQLETESTKLKYEYDVNQKAMEQLNV